MSQFRLLLLFALAMLSIVCAQTARAETCGDYLAMSHSATSHSASHIAPATGATENPLGPVKQCSGPRCSKSNPNPVPFPAPAPVQLRPDRQVVAILNQTQEQREFARSYLPFMLDTYSLELPSGIFHPPRMA